LRFKAKVFLLVIITVCFLANVVFFFEDEHLLVILVGFMFWLSLALVKSTATGVIITNQTETLKLLVKQQLIREFLQDETERTFDKLVLLVDEVARITEEMVSLVPTLLCNELNHGMQLNAINSVNNVLANIAGEVEKNQEIVAGQFSSDFLAAFGSDDEE
jgi:hypothetical protein